MDTLETLIDALSVCGVPVKPFYTERAENCIVYKFSTVSDNGAVEVDKFDVRIFAESLENARRLEKLVKQALLTIGDKPKNGFNSVAVNGGGVLKDTNTNMVQILLFFYITLKSEVTLQ